MLTIVFTFVKLITVIDDGILILRMENDGKVNPGVIVTPCHRNSGMSEQDYARCKVLHNVGGYDYHRLTGTN